MSDSSGELRHICWSECFGFTQIFRAFRIAIAPTMLILAFCGVFGVYVAGRVLDGLWAKSSQPVVVTVGDVKTTELDYFLTNGREATAEWIDAKTKAEGTTRTGVFKILLRHTRTTINRATHAAATGDIPGFVASARDFFRSKLWLLSAHPGYAIVFGFITLAIWALFGGAACRSAALHATRDERLPIMQALCFSRGKFLSFFAAPLMPAIFVLFFALALFLCGLVGAIPAVGDILAGVLLFIAIIIGLIAAFVLIGGLAGVNLMYPTIAVEGSDAFDAMSRSFSYIYQRPWRAAFYAVVSAVYGAICLIFVKLFVRVALWAVHFFVGLSMNWGSASLADPKADAVGKMDAMWSGPSLFGDTTFWGGFDGPEVAGATWLGQIFFKLWIYIVFGFVAAYAVSFFYSACTMIYLLLRKHVDATDMEDVYLEEAEALAPPADVPAAGQDQPREEPPAADAATSGP